jgi:acetylornithine deacetylase/succinyl-diaminopimelate desuccinylase-like protein
MQAWKEYQEKNKDRFLNELLEMLRIPSVSANSEHKDDMKKCAEMVKQRLLEAGADKAAVYPTDGHPVVCRKNDRSFQTYCISIWSL